MDWFRTPGIWVQFLALAHLPVTVPECFDPSKNHVLIFKSWDDCLLHGVPVRVTYNNAKKTFSRIPWHIVSQNG